MKKIMLILIATFVLFSKFTYAACVVPELPSNLSIKEHLIAFTTTFSVGEDHGEIKRKIITLVPNYYWVSQDGEKIATAKRALVSWGVKIDVYDCEGEKIGTIQEKVFKSLFKVKTEYHILNAAGEKIAESTKIDLGVSTITISNNGSKVATLKRPWIKLTDKWDLDISDHNTVV